MNEPQRLGGSEISDLNEITSRVIGAAIDVHRSLGPGLLESIYERALAIEFDERDIRYRQQPRIPALYKGRMLGTYRVDFIVEQAVLVEIKSVVALTPVFDAQLISYLRLTKKRLGLLINFHEAVLKGGIRRLIV